MVTRFRAYVTPGTRESLMQYELSPVIPDQLGPVGSSAGTKRTPLISLVPVHPTLPYPLALPKSPLTDGVELGLPPMVATCYNNRGEGCQAKPEDNH